MSMLPKVYCLMGPTAVGKTDVAIEWVQQYPCDIISVDSALIYRQMDIGTAKPDAASLAIAPHQLIDIIDPSQQYSVADFCRDADAAITVSLKQQRIPLLVGGTMMYFKALQQGLSPLPAADPDIRQQLAIEFVEHGLVKMHQQLQQVDPKAATKIKPTDSQRLQRALEVYRISGKSLSELQQQPRPLLSYEFINIAIMPTERTQLHQRIEHRFHRMIDNGLIDEVQQLKKRGNLSLEMPSMRAVGYRQVWEYLQGKYDQTEMIAKGVAATRQLAKRQITWLRRWPTLETYSDHAILLQQTEKIFRGE